MRLKLVNSPNKKESHNGTEKTGIDVPQGEWRTNCRRNIRCGACFSDYNFADVGVRRIALIGRNEERGKKAREILFDLFPQIQVEFIAADATDTEQARRAHETAESLIGNLNILMNSINSFSVAKLFYESAIEEILPTVVPLQIALLNMCNVVLTGYARCANAA